jgi:DNA-binding FrmR family transcriptional regulator
MSVNEHSKHHVYSRAEGHSHAHAEGHSHAHAEGHSHAHAEGHSHEHAEGHSHEYAEGHSHEHVHAGGHGHTHAHSHEETVRIRNRLARLIGHLESIKRMVEDERDCTEILIQLAAVKSAINNTGKVILKEHIKSCITTAIREEDTSELEALNRAIDSFIK